MEEIEVGEYVRTEEGIIQKCTDVDNSYVYVDDVLSYNFQGDIEIPNSYTEKTKIVKHSKNIIDLIEIGDYVNGREVKHIAMFEGFPDYPKLIFVDEKHLIPDDTAENKDIKSIATKQQFESIEYKI